MLCCMLEFLLHFMQAKQGLPYVHSALLLLTAIAQSEKVRLGVVVGRGGGMGAGFCSWVLDCCHLRHEYVCRFMSSTGKGLF